MNLIKFHFGLQWNGSAISSVLSKLMTKFNSVASMYQSTRPWSQIDILGSIDVVSTMVLRVSHQSNNRNVYWEEQHYKQLYKPIFVMPVKYRVHSIVWSKVNVE
mmetsp:Transcript_7312/g.15299  ORF Transcript_7312/g.15299 Transcript_7312/m.15299 type:complete len:104 (-) Transcript_7312:438-749(-)